MNRAPKRRPLRRLLGKLWLRWKAGRTARLTIGVVTALLLSVIVGAKILPPAVHWVIGDSADRTIYAPRSTSYVDQEATEKLRDQARESAKKEYRNEKQQAHDEMLSKVDRVFAVVAQMPDGSQESQDAVVQQLSPAIKLSDESIRRLLALDADDLERAHARARRVVDRESDQETRSDVQGDEKAAFARIDHVAASLTSQPEVRTVVQEVSQAVFRPNQILDRDKTEQRREEAASEVEPVTGQIREGEAIIRQGDIVAQKHIDKLTALGLTRTEVKYDRLGFLVVLMAGCVLAIGFLLAYFSPEVYYGVSQLAALAGVSLLGSLIINLGSRSPLASPYITLFSAEFCTLIVTTLMGVFPALMGMVPLAVVAAILIAHDPLTQAAAVLGGVGGILASRGLSYVPLGTIWLGIRLGIGNALALTVVDGAVAGPVERTLEQWPWRVGGSLVAGLGAVVIGLYGIRLLERPLETVTEMRLLELSSPQEPLLHEFMVKAPGSYNSALHVSILARNAAEAISANALLTWVGAMYHDVGKILRPYFFTENQFGGNNPHDNLNPFLSALVVTAHVKEGQELGRKAGLPRPILDFITEHHGTSLVAYFYERAKALEGPSNVPEERFRYPGPRPRSKETGIVMLADGVEAAVRSLKDPTAHTVETMVEKVIQDKIAQGQLEECPLSLRDIAAIRESFIQTFHAIYHTRVEYPTTGEQVAEQLGVSEHGSPRPQ